MALPVWPATLQYRSLRDAWGGVPFRDPLGTEMEGGNTRLRRRPGDDVGTYAWAGIFNAAQMATFMGFVETTTGNGSSRFTMQVSRDGVTYVSRTVQIVVGSLKFSSAGGANTQVSFSLLVFPDGVVA
ncbi:MAG: hypothetical protein B7Y12_02200 [Rhizobiales bacterium 24-66-13]|jgi:hypothetical protein|nr:MAG: hypothetical protein B7Z41_03120 [Rhizobiales bacterium 12-66-7]OYY88832.1 MAG: hypothetical protein B7Y61_01230 [Rhizobiales bacterium 35-66-30]OYZ82826.1 MAG: hypothetical protein B7Y12_02200 [Rhizobiales bacterium 24-66-13]OZB11859.1 MAG: hypothetical protein B7X67_02180 [Rhizobiales bacterium 39-66-18]HQS08715.1 hypothetical protein [Xanthobacteraceae bacterium]